MSKELFKSKIYGTGSYVPEKVLSNEDLEKIVICDARWIVSRTGIETRRVAADDELTSDLALEACRKALEMAGREPKDVDMILLATVSPDQVMPNTACVLQDKLGCRNIMSVDLSAACTGFLYALSMANQYIRTGTYKNILVVGAEIMTRFVNYQDRNTCVLFGDGAGVFLLGRSEKEDESEILNEQLHAEGQLGDLFTLLGGGSKYPMSEEVLESGKQYMQMKGAEVFKNAVRMMSDRCREAIEKEGIADEQVAWIIPHQANARILYAVAEELGFPKEKVLINIENRGNTSAATVPIAFDEAVRDGRIQRGQYLLLTAFGAGVTNGSILLKY